VTERNESLVESAQLGSGIALVYRALDQLVAEYALADAALVVELPGFGRQLLHAGRRPLHDDVAGWHSAPPGLYFDPPVDDTPSSEGFAPHLLSELMIALGTLGLRHDGLAETRLPEPTGTDTEIETETETELQ
jgi:hypothetical protein